MNRIALRCLGASKQIALPSQPLIPRTLHSTASPDKLSGKVAVVTASTDGIGLGIAKSLASYGAKVVISSRKEKNVLRAVEELQGEGLQVEGVVCHVGKKEDRENLLTKTVELFGGLDILVSNAAVNPYFGPILSCPEDMWDKIFEINVKTSFLLFRDCVPLFNERGGGSAVFVSSIGGYEAIPMLGPYSISKTALLGLTKALATEVGSSNIRVNCLAPGIVRTKFAAALTESEEISEKALENIPLGRFGTPAEMGGIVSFLVSDEASYITGETVLVTGGVHARL